VCGAVASASSSYGTSYPVAAVNNNEPAGLNPGNGAYLNDATSNVFPDWVQITFNSTKTLNVGRVCGPVVTSNWPRRYFVSDLLGGRLRRRIRTFAILPSGRTGHALAIDFQPSRRSTTWMHS
jgi:hypothetical protein